VTAAARPRVLCVDDERNVLDGIAVNLRKDCEVISAGSGAEALRALEADPSITVVMSDMRMPGMDGATVLARARALRPDVPRILLTGQADMASAIAAVNDGQLFRFLTKPCTRDQLQATILAAIEQHRLLSAERVLLENTLHGSVAALVDILAMTNPAAFGRANRVKARGSVLAEALELEPRWQVEMAAMLQPIGYVVLPAATVDKLGAGRALTDDEHRMIARVPAVTEQLLAHIPRLEAVRAILAGAAQPPAPPARATGHVELAAEVLRIAGELDDLELRGTPIADGLALIRGRPGAYSEPVLIGAAYLVGDARPRFEVREVAIDDLRKGMVLAEDVRLANGTLLIARGYEVTAGFIERLRNFASGSVRGPLRVSVPTGA
jgi:CheY-like chemotaxis protein